MLAVTFLLPTWSFAEEATDYSENLYSEERIEELIDDFRTSQESVRTIAGLVRMLGNTDLSNVIELMKNWWWSCENEIRDLEYIQEELTAVNTSGETQAEILAKIMRIELGGADTNDPYGIMHTAAVGWSVLNRVDAGMGTLENVAKAPNQFSYRFSTEVRDDLLAIATDVLIRWYLEKTEGYGTTGRVLDDEYIYFWGDGTENHYYRDYRNRSDSEWCWSYPNPYDTLA
jgi:hypothetical protein